MLFEVALSIDHVSDFNNHIYCKSDKHEEILDYPRILIIVIGIICCVHVYQSVYKYM